MPRLKLTGEALEKHKAEKQQKRDEAAQKKREILARKFARIERRARELFEREKKSQKADSLNLRSSLAQRFSSAALANEVKVFEKDRTSEVKLLRDSKFNKKLILKTLHDYIGAVSSEYEGVIEVFNLTLGMIEDDIQFTKEDLINYNDPSRRAEIEERFLNTEYETMETMTNMIVETLDSPSGNGIVEQYVEVDAPNFNNVEKIRLPDGTLVFMSEEEDEDGTHKIYDISTLEYIGGVSQEPEETMENRVKRLTENSIKQNLGIGGYDPSQVPSAAEIKSAITSLFEDDPIKAEIKSLFKEEVVVSAPKETPRTFKKGFGIRRLRKGFGIKRLPKPQGKIANAMVAKGIVRTFDSSEEDSDLDPEDDDDEEIDGFKALPEELQRKLDFALNTDRFTKITNLNLRLNGEEFETIVLLNLGDDGENWEEHENPYFNFPLAFSDAGAIIGRYDITRKKLVNLADNAIGFSEKNKRVGIDSGEYDGGYDLDVILNSRELFDSSKLEEYFDNMTVFRGIDRLSEEPIYKEIVANYKLLEGLGGAASASGGGASGGAKVRVDEASILGVGREARVKGMMKYQEITNEDEIEANEAFFDRDKDNEELMVYYDDVSELFYASWDNNEIITNIKLVGASDEKGKLYYDFKKEEKAEQKEEQKEEEEEPFIEGAGAGAGAGSSAGGSNLGLDDPDLGKEKANEKLVDALESYQGNMDIIRTQLELSEPDWRHMYIKTDGGRYLADTYKRMGKTQQKKAQNKVVIAIAALDDLPTIGDFGAEGATADAIYEASRDYQDYYNQVYERMPEFDGDDRWFNEEYIDESIEWLRNRAEELRKEL